jgi:hypothetical protein
VARPDTPVSEGVRSLEVRWIFPGQPVAALAEWFERFPAGVEAREDTYLVSPHLRGLSVKVRGGGALEVKAYRGSPGILEVACRARGRMESWQKWSFPCGPLGQGDVPTAGWTPVHKRISWIALANGQIQFPLPGPGGGPASKLELTQIHMRDEPWWTLGIEVKGPSGLRRRELEVTVALMVTQALPDDIELGTDHSTSYAQWLRRAAVAPGEAHPPWGDGSGPLTHQAG